MKIIKIGFLIIRLAGLTGGTLFFISPANAAPVYSPYHHSKEAELPRAEKRRLTEEIRRFEELRLAQERRRIE